MAIALGGLNIALQESLFWLNVHLELFAIEQHALRRMRKHLATNPGWVDALEVDVKPLEIELERVTKRLRHWEEVVDKVRSGRR